MTPMKKNDMQKEAINTEALPIIIPQNVTIDLNLRIFYSLPFIVCRELVLLIQRLIWKAS